MTWATCHVPGCGNADRAINVGDLTYTDDADGIERTATVTCGGGCNQPVTDLSDDAPNRKESAPDA